MLYMRRTKPYIALMSLRFKSLDELGRGAWRVASVLPNGKLPRPARRCRSSQRSGPTPHDMLWEAVRQRWPDAERELAGAVPDRKFRLDIGFVAARLAVEVDGFAHHGKYVADFRRDRLRQNLLTLAGWRILRFAAGDIRGDLQGCLATIEAALAAPMPARANTSDLS